jgi:DNA-binding GntR family transcriptional regulator
MNNLEKRAYRHLRRELLRGNIQAGDRLSDLALSKRIGMSRTPVRHAIRMLESDGIAKSLPGGGSIVRRPSRKSMGVLFDLRIMIEGYAAGRAARAMSEADLEKLRETQREMRRILEGMRGQSSPEFTEDFRFRLTRQEVIFHQTILRAGGARALSKLITDLGILGRLYYGNRSPSANPLRDAAHAYLAHHRVLRPLERRDPKAARAAMRWHIRTAKVGFMPRTSVSKLEAER